MSIQNIKNDTTPIYEKLVNATMTFKGPYFCMLEL